jgi:hypothetical protein
MPPGHSTEQSGPAKLELQKHVPSGWHLPRHPAGSMCVFLSSLGKISLQHILFDSVMDDDVVEESIGLSRKRFRGFHDLSAAF